MQRDASTLTSQELIRDLGEKAKAASTALVDVSEEDINKALCATAKALRAKTSFIIDKNKLDIQRAQARGLSRAQIDRLMLDDDRIEAMATSLEDIARLPDPVGRQIDSKNRPNGMTIDKVTIPFGVLGLIYESRPNVTIDAAALALKSHNAIILRGGSESLSSSLALHTVFTKVLEDHGLPADAVGIVRVSDRSVVTEMLHADYYIDVMIPRGGPGLIERVTREAKMPVFAHLDGICHVYLHEDADPDIARAVTLNAKMRRTGICGAAETLLVDKNFPEDKAKAIVKELLDIRCEVIGDTKAQSYDSRVGLAKDIDWATEYLDAKISVKHVKNIQDAIEHINHFGSHHTDSIITSNEKAAGDFFKYVDSGIVMHNTSTQFADGGEFGMGAEIGISTGKLHARGPVGLEQLVTYKYLVKGSGQTRP